MGQDEKNGYELAAVESTGYASPSQSPRTADGSQENDVAFLQTRTQRIFNEKQLFAFSLVYMGTWSGVPANMYYSMYNGGPAAWFASYVIVATGALLQCAAFGEIASIQPIAGAQYYWTYAFAPRSSKRFLTWLQGWITWTAYVATFASSLNFGTSILEGLIQLNNPDYEVVGWRTTVITLSSLALLTLVNLYAFRIVPWFEMVAGVINVLLFLVFIIVFLVMAPKNSGDIFTMSNVSSGWDNYFVASQVGALSNIWLFIGFEAIIHMGEETKNAKTIVPRSLFWSMAANAALGFVMLVVTLFCMPPVDEILDAASPVVALLLHVTGSTPATTVLGASQFLLAYSATMGNVASVSRLTWAWARDGGLPRYFGHVDGRRRIPFRAVWLTSAIVALLSLLNLGSATYVALGAITSLSSMAMYLSYGVVLAVVLQARLAGRLPIGPWNWGPRRGALINAGALAYTLYVLVWFPFPQDLPVDASNMNYCGPVLGAVLLFAVSFWFVRRNHWQGPNQAVVDLVLRAEE
ncbi:amino acid permease [Truncatella angustata]|uniref:Amino acid permease n=1 Tax=Truncatella angustata TaxID=152316 RepID=A0A9P8UZ63_9PEZI|nr:amino acid permease [Truncatella angustata]KAH6661271.1 amino acid permease [Truncatella angustata]